MSLTLIWAALLIAIFDWFAVAKGWKTIEYLAKPSVMIALLVWLWTIGGGTGQLVWFVFGVVFSLAGDILFMLPKQQFVGGLVAFLLAHIAYLIGFNDTIPPLNLVSIVLAVMVGITSYRLAREILGNLASTGNSKLRIPIAIYIVAISLMLLSALLTLVRPEWSIGTALLVSGGAISFAFSDSVLAWNRFVAPLKYENLTVMISYHIGQIFIILGAGLHYIAQ